MATKNNTDPVPTIKVDEPTQTTPQIDNPTKDDLINSETDGEVPQIREEAPGNLVIEKEIPKNAYMHDKDVWPNGEIKTDNYSPIKTGEIMEILVTESVKTTKVALSDSSDSPSFTHNGKKYKVILPKVQIPEMGILTALDIASDAAAQKYLVENAVGSTIQEVVE